MSTPAKRNIADAQDDSEPGPFRKGGGSPADWRKAVPQSFRSEEVRAIAKVLASLESGATSASKLMLAMRFEDSIFQSASSLDDYKKKIAKRLKKLQKSYKPPPEATTGAPSIVATSEEDLSQIEGELRDAYGDDLLFIARHANGAVEAMREKDGDQKANLLRQHTDNAKQWAVDVGLTLPKEAGEHPARRRVRDADFLSKIRTYLESRVPNIRSHIVKLMFPDMFLEETLAKVETDTMEEATTSLMASALRRAFQQSGHAPPPFDVAEVRRLLERAGAPVPIPRRSGGGTDAREAAAAHVERIRAASQALVAYLGLNAEGKAALPGCLKRSHAMAIESLGHVEEQYGLMQGDDEVDESGRRIVRLEDAWNRAMEYRSEEEADGADPPSIDEDGGSSNRNKRLKTDVSSHRPVVIRSKVLLTPGRKTLSNLLHQLKMKKAELIRPLIDGPGSRLRMVFGSAFEMTVFLVPLLVTIRALPATATDKKGDDVDADVDAEGKTEFRKMIVDGGLPTWKSCEFSNRVTSPRELTVLGVTGTDATVGMIAAKKLEYASARATHVLRRCFERCYEDHNKSEFEIELLEASALLKFLQIARTTYLPGWKDDDV